MRKVGAKWHTYIRMLGDNKHTRYMLLHLTNHDDGRDLMKDAIWKVAPDGGYYARKSVDIAQQLLIEPEPDLAPLRDWVRHRLEGWSETMAGSSDRTSTRTLARDAPQSTNS